MSARASDLEVFLTVLPVIQALLANPNYTNPERLLTALHVWTRPRSSKLRLHPTDKLEVLADIMKQVREDHRFSADEDRFRAAVVEIRERSPFFVPNSKVR